MRQPVLSCQSQVTSIFQGQDFYLKRIHLKLLLLSRKTPNASTGTPLLKLQKQRLDTRPRLIFTQITSSETLC